MRPGALISAVSHVVLVAFVLLGTPKLFDDIPVQTVEVDIVPSQDAPPEPTKEQPPEVKPKDDKSAAFDPFAEQAKPSQQATAEKTQKPQPEPKPQAPAQQATGPQTPTQQATGPQTPPPAAQPQPAAPWIFDPANIPTLMDMPNAPQFGFDSESTTTANLTAEEKAALKAHLRKCWKLPAGISPAQSTRVVMRIYLKRDGVLAADPTLIEASASRDGPSIMQAAIRTLKDCQPYAFLPADKYKEWKVLDMSFSPREMAGG